MTGKTRHRAAASPGRLAAAVLCAAVLAAAPPVFPQAPQTASSPLEAVVRFNPDLFQTEDLLMRGSSITREINFTRPSEWEVVAGTELRLVVEHSPELMPQRSTLTVAINGTTLASLRLDESNVRPTEVVVPIPPALLFEYNRLSLTANQHYTLDCEDPFNAALWTKVASGSHILFRYRPAPLTPDLAHLPAPIFSPLRYGPASVQFLLPESPSPETLEAISIVGVWFGRAAAYRPTRIGVISSFEEAEGHVVAVGAPSELPMLERVGVVTADEANAGLLRTGSVPGRPDAAFLAVTGGSGVGVLAAARALTQPADGTLAAGDSYIVTNVSTPAPSRPNEWPGFIPTRERFTLGELGVEDTTVRGVSSLPVTVEFKRPPQFQFVEGEPEMTLRYAYGAQLDTRLSSVEVTIDGVTVKSIALDDADGEAAAERTFPIPDYRLLNENSKLRVVFHLFPKDYDPCRRMSDQQIWGTLLASTELKLPRDYYDELPDLDALRNGGFPFTRRQDLGGAAIVVGDRPSRTELACALEIAVRFGRLTKADSVALRTVTTSLIESVADRDLVVIGVRASQPLLDRVIASPAGRDAVLGEPGQDQGVVEEVISPWGRETVALAVAGRDVAALEKARAAIADDKLFVTLGGSVALVAGSGNRLAMRTLQAVPRRLVGELPWHRQPLIWLKRNWVVVIAGGLLGVAIFYFLIRILLLQYRERRRRAGLGAIP